LNRGVKRLELWQNKVDGLRVLVDRRHGGAFLDVAIVIA
jgi:hypothetical protein